MRALLFFILASTSLSAFGMCPDLSGNYTCRERGKVWSETLIVSEVNGTYRYNFITMGESVIFIADGKVRPQNLGTNSPLYDFIYTATCETPNQLSIEMEAKSVENGADVLVKNEFYLDQGSNLILNFSGNFGNYSVPETLRVCTRK